MKNWGHPFWALAVHEAAHMVIGVLFDHAPLQISLVPGQWSASMSLETGFAPEQWRMDLLVTLAGEIAQRRANPSGETLYDEKGRRRATDDYEKAWRAVGRFNHNGDILEIRRLARARMEEGERVASGLIIELWPVIEMLADAILTEGGTLGRETLAKFLQEEFPFERRKELHAACEFANRPPFGG